MATVLRRPMFRLGGPSSDGVGITSGLRRYGFAFGNTGAQREYLEEKETQGNNIDEQIQEFTYDSGDNGSKELVDKAREEILNPGKATYGFKELIADAYRTSKGAATGTDWLENAADLALERGDAAKLKA